MQLLRVGLSGWTASFRYPAFISGFQPTLPVPPLSTIYGILVGREGGLRQADRYGRGIRFFEPWQGGGPGNHL